MNTKTEEHVEQVDEFEPIELGTVSEETKGQTGVPPENGDPFTSMLA